MNTPKTLLCLIFFAALSTGMPAQAQQKDSMLQFQLSDQLKQSAAQWNRGDLDGFLADYLKTGEMTFTSGGRILKGFEALDSRYRKSYGDTGQTMGNLSFSDLEVWRLGESNALVLGRWRLVREEGKDEGVFTLVMTKVGNDWKILHDHTSTGKGP